MAYYFFFSDDSIRELRSPVIRKTCFRQKKGIPLSYHESSDHGFPSRTVAVRDPQEHSKADSEVSPNRMYYAHGVSCCFQFT